MHMDIFDITIPLSEKTPVWEGEKGLSIKKTDAISRGDTFNVTRIAMSLHTGTHIDAPNHLLPEGMTIDKIALKRFIGPAQVVDVPDGVTELNVAVFEKLDLLPKFKHLLFKTRNSRFWVNEPYAFRKDYTALTRDGAVFLADLGYELIGIDSFSISVFSDLVEPHRILMKKGILVLENIDLHAVRAGVYTLYCLPIPIVGAEAAPVRAILIR